MTTIAWDGKTLAADSLGDQNGLRMETTKLHRGVLADGHPFILGAAGENSWANMLHQWVKTLTVERLKYEPYPHQCNDGADRNDPAAIIVLGKFGVFYKAGATFAQLEREFHAVGSGRDFAIASMHYGNPAEEAVRVACRYDCYSGGDVRTMEPSQ